MSATDGKYGVITAEKKQFCEGEPVFLFRATDPFAPEIIDRYAEMCQVEGCSLEHCAAVRAHASRIREWQKSNHTLVKPIPD